MRNLLDRAVLTDYAKNIFPLVPVPFGVSVHVRGRAAPLGAPDMRLWSSLSAVVCVAGWLFVASAQADTCPESKEGLTPAELCTEACPCEVREGGCERDDECLSGICSPMAGARFGLPQDMGVCTEARCRPVHPLVTDWSSCTEQCPCPEGWGDCDYDWDCAPGLFCGEDYGYLAGSSNEYLDICIASCPVFDELSVSERFCNNRCTCGVLQGHCDSDAECDAGLSCREGFGRWAGVDASWGVCAPTFNRQSPQPDYCATYGCDHGEGACRSSSDCKSGLLCARDLGAQYGMPATTDMCVRPVNITVRRRGDSSAGSVVLPSGRNCSGTCTVRTGERTEVAIRVTNLPGSSILKWTGCTRTVGNTCYVRADTARTVQADISRECPRSQPYCCARNSSGKCLFCERNRNACFGDISPGLPFRP